MKFHPVLILAAIIGISMTIISGFMFWNEYTFIIHSEKAPGEIIDYEARESSEGDTFYHPIVQFRTQDNHIIEFTSPTGENISINSPLLRQILQTDNTDDKDNLVEVLYDPENPQNAKINSFFNIWLWPSIALIIGLGFIFGLFYELYLSIKYKKTMEKVRKTPPKKIDPDWLKIISKKH